MPRALALGNGRLHVAWDAAYRLREATWPHVGDPNHLLGRPCRLGVQAGRTFRWVPDGFAGVATWERDSAVTDVLLSSARLGLDLRILDALHPTEPLLVRRFRVASRKGARRVRLFLHEDLKIGGSDVGDTVLKDPVTGGLLHYKDDVVTLWNASRVDAWACGVTGFRGLEGTWRDAEDGELSGNPVAHGSVDGVLRVPLDVPARGWVEATAWTAFGPDVSAVRRLDDLAREHDVHALARAASRAVVAAAPRPRGLDAGARALYARSLHAVRALVDAEGGVLAGVDSDILTFNRDTYAYVWPRDAAFVGRTLQRAGARDLADAALRFLARAPHVDGARLHKYTVGGRMASTWHAWERDGKAEAPVQEDETALVLWLAAHASPRVRRSVWREQGRPMADFLVTFRRDGLPLPSWDLWEERRGVHLYTCATVVAGLRAAAEMAGEAGHASRARRYAEAAEETRAATLRALWMPGPGRFARRIDERGAPDPTPDASLWALVAFDLLPAVDGRARATLDAVFGACAVRPPTRRRGGKRAPRPWIGGTARYPGDLYHRTDEDVSNPWVICTLWAGLWAATKGDRRGLLDALAWCVERAGPAMSLAEQYHPSTGAPLSVAPLTWSHATFIDAALVAATAPGRGR